MYFLDIIIPQYNETEETLKALLDSIARQKNVDFKEIGVIVINGGSEVKPSKEFLDSYKELNITYMDTIDRTTQGQAEQIALDSSTAEYVTFIDADDEMFGDASLCEIVFGLHKNPINLLMTAMDQENKIGGKIVHQMVDYRHIRTLHGVFIKREYLKKYNVHFNDRLNYYEDTYFVNCLTVRNDFMMIGNVTYVWKYNEQSKSLANKYPPCVRKFKDMLYSFSDTYDYYESQNVPKKEFYIIQQIIELALLVESSFFRPSDLKEQKLEYERMVFELYKKHEDKFKAIQYMQRLHCIQYKLKDMAAFYKGIKFYEGFDEFISRMEKQYK